MFGYFRASQVRISRCFFLPAALILICGTCQASVSPPSDTAYHLTDSVTATAPSSQSKTPQDYGLSPIKVTAFDTENDAGGSITLNWDDTEFGKLDGFHSFEIRRQNPGLGSDDSIASVTLGVGSYVDRELSNDSFYTYTLVTLVNGNRIVSAPSQPVKPRLQWFNTSTWNLLVIGVIFCGSVIFFIETAKRGRKLFLRRIAGLEAVDEAVGRATEMGRPILFIAGIQDMDDVQTIAGLTILGYISRIIAQYDSKINMPVRASLVMTAAREVIRQAYLVAGRPDAYSDDMVHYVTDEQFGFVAAVDGIMVRERPAACFFLGAFFAESLIMAETGNSIQAIQIAGTAMPAQLPFFVVACDYTLIGEELFAASAYLSEEPRQLGSLKGQDVGKGVAMAFILLGTIAVTAASAWNWEPMRWLERLLLRVFSTS